MDVLNVDIPEDRHESFGRSGAKWEEARRNSKGQEKAGDRKFLGKTNIWDVKHQMWNLQNV